MSKIQVRADSIQKRQIQGWQTPVRGYTTESGQTIQPIQTNTSNTFQVNEAVNYGDICSIFEGKIYLANNIDKPAFGFASKGAAIGEYITLIDYGTIELTNIVENKNIYLGYEEITQEFPKLIKGTIFQLLGAGLANNLIFIDIKEGEYIV